MQEAGVADFDGYSLFGLFAPARTSADIIRKITKTSLRWQMKRLELLHEAVPKIATIAVLLNPANPQATQLKK